MLFRSLNTVVANLKNSPNAITLSSLFSSIAVSLVNTQVDAFYGGLEDVQVTQATPDQVALIKQSTARDITLLFEKIVARQDIGTDFTSRHKKMMENLNALNTRLSKITQEEKDIRAVKAEHALTARDLLSVIESSIGDRFDERVLFSLNERRVNRLEKRNKEKAELEELTTILKLYSQVQALIGKALAEKTSGGSGHYKPSSIFTYTDFGYKDQSAFEKGPEFKYLESKITPNRRLDGVPYFTHQQFLESNGFTISTPSHNAYYDLSDGGKYLTNFSTSVSDKTKPLNNEVQLKTTALSDTSSQYNATVEAMNKFVQKYSSILQEILRAI